MAPLLMTTSNVRTTRLVAGVICVLALVTACGSGTGTAQPQPSPDRITGGGSCPVAESQDLTFSGALTGHVACSTSTASCSTTASTPSLTLPLNERVGSQAVQLLIAFRFFRENLTTDRLGTYAAGRLGDAQDSSSYGASLDGFGHWETPTPGGSMTLSTDDAKGASGTLDIKLALGAKTIAVAGSWRCVRP
jgi:hypothetical protein